MHLILYFNYITLSLLHYYLLINVKYFNKLLFDFTPEQSNSFFNFSLKVVPNLIHLEIFYFINFFNVFLKKKKKLII